MPSAKPDITLGNSDENIRTITLDIADVHPGRLTLLEALDMTDASGIDPDEFGTIMEGASLSKKARLIYAMAWVLLRRQEPDVTYEEMLTYNVNVTGTQLDDKKEERRAQAVMSVASLAHVSPDEAKNMTLAEVAAVVELNKTRRPVRRQTARRRRAS